jgi:hypothetical protein
LKERSAEDEFRISKRQSGIRYLKEVPSREISSAQKIDSIVLGRGFSDIFQIQKMNLMDLLRFIIRVVLGLGNSQMMEFMIRGDNLWSLAIIALSRFRMALNLLRRTSFLGRAQLGPESSENLSSLMRGLGNLPQGERISATSLQRKIF